MRAVLEARRSHVRGDPLRFRVLEGPIDRLRGLLGTGPDACPVVLVGCSSVHTFGMRYRLDVAFVGPGGLVLEVWRSVPPGRVLANRQAHMTFERPHGRGAWLARGERVRLRRVEEEGYAGE